MTTRGEDHEDRSVKNLAAYLALGVTVDGDCEVLGIWWQETEGAKFWLSVFNDLQRRGVQDVLIACVDGLKGDLPLKSWSRDLEPSGTPEDQMPPGVRQKSVVRSLSWPALGRV